MGPPDDGAHGGPENHRGRVRLRCRNEKAEGREAPEKGPPYLIGGRPSFSFYLALPFAALFLSPLCRLRSLSTALPTVSVSANGNLRRLLGSSLFFIYFFFSREFRPYTLIRIKVPQCHSAELPRFDRSIEASLHC